VSEFINRPQTKELINRPQNKVAFFVSVGVFFCANGLSLWGDSLDWQEIGFLPGLFFLLLGGYRLLQFFGVEFGQENREISR